MKIEKSIIKNILIIITMIIISGIIFIYQTQKIGFHEDEIYSIATSVNAENGLMSPYGVNWIPDNEKPQWKTKEFVKNYMTLTLDNYLNIKAIYHNQEMDNHPPFFYTLVHISTMLFFRKIYKIFSICCKYNCIYIKLFRY